MAKCLHCGNEHENKCPLIKEIEYYEDGTVKKVVYITSADYVNNYFPHQTTYRYPPNQDPYLYWTTTTNDYKTQT